MNSDTNTNHRLEGVISLPLWRKRYGVYVINITDTKESFFIYDKYDIHIHITSRP